MFQKFLIVFSSIMVTACSGGPWPDSDQNNFIAECKSEGGKTSYCKCYLENVMEKYPNASDWKQMDFETAVELANNCE